MIDPVFAVLSVLLISYGVITGARADSNPPRHRHRAPRVPRQRSHRQPTELPK